MKRKTMVLACACVLVACHKDASRGGDTKVTAPSPVTFSGGPATVASPGGAGQSGDVTPSKPVTQDQAKPGVADQAPTRSPDVIFVPTPEPVVKQMLTMAKVGPNDVVYDLGSGDGRILIAAARDFGARGVGIDIDPTRVKEARANVKRAGLEDKIEIRQGDLFQQDLSEATVVTLYLLESLNKKLMPKLQRELRPGARIVSQSFSMGDWKPVQQADVNGTPVYLWTIQKEGAGRGTTGRR